MKINPIDYRIELIEDISVGNIIKKIIHILIISDFTEDGLFEIAKTEINNYIKNTPVNSITVGFYTNEVNANDGHTHGQVVYAPNGSVADASKVTTGDYSTFKFSNQIRTFQFSAGMRPEIFSQVMNIKPKGYPK